MLKSKHQNNKHEVRRSMNIVVCDDNLAFARLLESKIMQFFARKEKMCTISVFSNPNELMKEDLSYRHVLFLDIDMPDVSGLEIARIIRKKNYNICIVFVTAWIQYAPAGYRVNAFRYLLKQELNTELNSCLEDILESLSQKQEQIQLPGKEYVYDLYLDEILYLEGSPNRLVIVHTTDEQLIECRGKLADLAEQLEDKGFLRIQKSFIVNMKHVKQIKGYYTHLKNGESLKTAERGYAQIYNRFLIWKGNHI